MTPSTISLCSSGDGYRNPTREIAANTKGNRERRAQYAIPAAKYEQLLRAKSLKVSAVRVRTLAHMTISLHSLHTFIVGRARLDEAT